MQPCLSELFADMRHGGGGLVAIDGDAHELGAGAGERRDLGDRSFESAVSVLVMDWTTIGAPPPTMTAPGPLPTRTPTEAPARRRPRLDGLGPERNTGSGC